MPEDGLLNDDARSSNKETPSSCHAPERTVGCFTNMALSLAHAHAGPTGVRNGTGSHRPTRTASRRAEDFLLDRR